MMMAVSFVPPTIILDLVFMAMLVVVAFAIVRLRSLFAIVMLQGVYSLVSAAWFVSLDAVDVAFTEAAVGAGVSTVLMLAAMLLADRKSNPVPVSKQIAPLIVVIVAGLAMFYAIGDMPAYGDVNSPANTGPGMDYVERTVDEIHIPNVVTAVLASYRGYDTFGEAVVIFAAGLGILLLLGLNGNAGRWSATPNGQRISAPSAPSAATPRPNSKSRPKNQPRPKPQPSASLKGSIKEPGYIKTTPPQASPEPVKGPVVETSVVDKSAIKTPAAKKRGRPAGSKNKAKAAPKSKTKSAAKLNASKAKLEAAAAPKRRGRPKGSTNKSKAVAPKAKEAAAPKRRGRPPGSKNKAKSTVAKAAKTAPKRGRGRPKGSKNKPKDGGKS